MRSPHRRRALGILMTASLFGLMVQTSVAQAAAAPPGPSAPPGAQMTRGQLASAIMNTFQLTPESEGPLFDDVPAKEPDRTAIETVTGDYIMTGTSEFSFQPNRPATRLDLAEALVNELGLKDAVQYLTAQPSVTDVNQIPSAEWGYVDAALQLHLLSADAKGRFDPNGPVTRQLYDAAVAVAQSTTPAQVSSVANQVADTMWLGFPYWENASLNVNVGTQIQQIAYEVEHGELVLPGLATLSASAGTLGANGSYTAPSQPGLATVTATADGTSISKSLTFSVYDPVGLQFDASTPSFITAGNAVKVVGDVISPNPSNLSTNAVDKADSGRALTLTVTDSSGNTTNLTANDASGQASFSWTPQAAGDYTLSLSASGFTTVTKTVQVEAQPLATASVTLGKSSFGYNQSVPVSVYLAPTGSTPLPAYLPITVTAAGSGSVNNVTASVYTPAAEQPGGVVIGNLTGGPSPGLVSVTVSNPGNVFAAAKASANVVSLGTITVTVPSTPQPAGSTVTVSAQITLSNGQPAPAGIAVSFTPRAPDGERGLLSTRSEVNTAVGTTNSAGVATVNLEDQYMAGTYQLSVTANGYTSAATTYQVSPGPAVKLDAVVAPSPFIFAGESASLNVAAVDQYGNIVPGVSVPVHVEFHGRDGQLQMSSTQVTGEGTVGTVTAGQVQGTDEISVTSSAFPGQQIHLPVKVYTNPVQLLQGKGAWATYGVFGSMGEQGMIDAMKAQGVTHLYLETATSRSGFYGQLPLDRIVDLAHQNGIAVINWTYAALTNLSADEAYAQSALTYKTQLGSMTDGYTGDYEENLNAPTMQAFSAFIRNLIGPNEPYVATIYPPQSGFATPMSTLAQYVNAFAPMDYWHSKERDYTFSDVYAYVTDSINQIKAAAPGVPIEIIAETYDMWTSSGTGVYSPTAVEEEAAMMAATDGGAVGVSFYDLSTMNQDESEVISQLPYPV
ncbi:MAG: S-layer homology domain-containing protein, partial [Alicyclobacillus sp.]|nr:S-layer homology domain-containing protein [Alicyclobacillus sp.]